MKVTAGAVTLLRNLCLRVTRLIRGTRRLAIRDQRRRGRVETRKIARRALPRLSRGERRSADTNHASVVHGLPRRHRSFIYKRR